MGRIPRQHAFQANQTGPARLGRQAGQASQASWADLARLGRLGQAGPAKIDKSCESSLTIPKCAAELGDLEKQGVGPKSFHKAEGKQFPETRKQQIGCMFLLNPLFVFAGFERLKAQKAQETKHRVMDCPVCRLVVDCEVLARQRNEYTNKRKDSVSSCFDLF